MTEHPSKTRLVDAAIDLVRTKGYNAMRIDDVCATAGVTKGSFFHHFKAKDDLALAAAEEWRQRAMGLCETVSSARFPDPCDRLLAYLDLRRELIAGDMVEWTCFGGTMIQEIHLTHPGLRDACQRGIADHAAELAAVIETARRQHGIVADWTADSLAQHILAVIQGALLLAKGGQDPAVAHQAIGHLRRYVEQLFDRRPRA
jgi:TetR/AcrR family transcriptional repressor of nem operon